MSVEYDVKSSRADEVEEEGDVLPPSSEQLIRRMRIWPKLSQLPENRSRPNPETTVGAEDVFMQSISSKEEDIKMEEDSLDELESMGDEGIVKCRNLSIEDWFSMFRHKKVKLADDHFTLNQARLAMKSGFSAELGQSGSKYVPHERDTFQSIREQILSIQQFSSMVDYRIKN